MKSNVEKLISALLLITGGSYVLFHYLGTKTLSVDNFSNYTFIKNTDERDGGNSSIDILSAGDTLIYRYLMDRKDAPHQFAALRISNFDMDLTPFDSVKIVSQTSSGNSLRLTLKNFDSKFSKVENPDSYLFNELEYVPIGLDASLNVGLESFHVPSWWIGMNKIDLSVLAQSFDNIIELEFSNGTYAPSAVYDTVYIDKILFEGEVVSTIHFQRGVILLWLISAIIFVIFKQLKYLKLFKHNAKYLARQNEFLEQQLMTDSLTKIGNRSAFEHDSKSFMKSTNVILILFDIDKFKDFNDENGHSAGDEVLVNVSQFAQRSIKDLGTIYRWFGDQFMIVVHDKNTIECLEFSEKLRASFDNTLQANNFIATCSFGLSQKYDDDTVYTLINRADQALHQAKSMGGNVVVNK